MTPEEEAIEGLETGRRRRCVCSDHSQPPGALVTRPVGHALPCRLSPHKK